MSIPNIQDQLFNEIRNLLPAEKPIADEISALLNISIDSSYRRIRGETPLVLQEVAELCRHFHLSVEQMINPGTNHVLFNNYRVHNQHYPYMAYLQDLRKQFNALHAYSSKEVIYMSKDLPIFYNFYFRPLMTFRYFFWMKVQVLDPLFEHRFFDLNMLPASVEELSTELIRAYSSIPSTEMWNMESINSTISQIEFAKTSGFFTNQKDVSVIYDSLEATILHLQEQAEYGCKFIPGDQCLNGEQNLKFFFNRVILGDNTIMVIADDLKMAFINYGNLNYMQTSDTAFCTALYEDFENLKRRSTLISVSSEKQRNIFFNILLSKVRERKQNAG
jgi:hypothetical protein